MASAGERGPRQRVGEKKPEARVIGERVEEQVEAERELIGKGEPGPATRLKAIEQLGEGAIDEGGVDAIGRVDVVSSAHLKKPLARRRG